MKDPPKPFFTGKIGMTKHAINRLKERDIDSTYVKSQLAFVPYEHGVREWRIPKTNIVIIIHDHSEEKRTIITLWRLIRNKKI